jgi:hypothetical protein
MKLTLHPLRTLALAAALASTGAIGQTVAVSAPDVFSASGSNATIDIQFGFSGNYLLLAADLQVEFDPTLLAWDQAATTLSVPGLTAPIDSIVADVNSNLIAIATLSSTAGSFSLVATPFNPPPLNSVLTLHAVFTVLPALAVGDSTAVLVSGNLTHDDFAAGVETAYNTSSRVYAIAAVPEPAAAWMLAAGLLGVGACVRRRSQGQLSPDRDPGATKSRSGHKTAALAG